MTKQGAQLIVEAHEIESIMDNDEERELLLENNPALYDAYMALLRLAARD